MLIVDRRIFEEFPGLRIGVIAAHGVDNRGGDPEIGRLLETATHALDGFGRISSSSARALLWCFVFCGASRFVLLLWVNNAG